jgi:FdhD protein
MQREYQSADHPAATAATRAVDVVRVRAGARAEAIDRAAAEEPLEIRLHGRRFATIMRTPGAERELAAGFLLAERIIRTADDLGTIEACRDGSARGNVVNVTLVDAEAAGRALEHRRDVTSASSCGVCGRATIESLTANLPSIASSLVMRSAAVTAMPNHLRAAQSAFDETGGLHAAGLFTAAGALVDIAEDVGRHNAVDKVIGRCLLAEQIPATHHALCVSGRTSFEIVQKAAVAGIPIVVAVSAPSSLAIDLALASGLTLVGFVRGDSFNVYTHGDRIV